MAQQYASKQPTGFKNRIEKIAIVGASGTVGKYITQQLVDNGKHEVTAITRAGGISKFPQGVRTAEVNYDDPDSIVKALQGQDGLIISMSTMAPRDTQSKLIDAAAKAGIRWVMPNEYGPEFVSQQGKDTGFYDGLFSARQQIEKLGMVWTVLTCSYWYEFSIATSPFAYGFDFSKKHLTLYDDGETKINTSTWLQCGHGVANLLALKLLPEDENDKSTTISRFFNEQLHISSFLLSQKDMFASVLRVTGGKESDWTVTSQPSPERFKEGWEKLKSGNREGFVQQMYSRTFFQDGCGNYEQRGVLVNDLLNLPKGDLDEATKRAVGMAESGEAAYH